MPVTYHLRISGRVQGVGFRQYMAYKARELGVAGWVRNRRDGSVEAMAHGPHAAIESLLECARRGPRSALVTDVQVTDGEGTYSTFETLPTE